MPTRLYLDTARLGLMRPGAQRLYQDFVRFAGEEGCTLYWETLLREGYQQCPEQLQRRYPALCPWRGIAGLKQSLREVVGASPESRVLLANRSAQLMRLAAKLLYRRCKNVLVTDLAWPRYLRLLRREQKRTSQHLTTAQVRSALFTSEMCGQELADVLAHRFVHSHCDGLFLPAVDHLGICLPVEQIVSAIRKRAELRYVVLDGAQAIAHVPLSLAQLGCDFFVAGCHKWLGGYHPLGIGVCGSPGSERFLEEYFDARGQRRGFGDPLLQFTEELEAGSTSRYGETVNVTPMLSAQGALHDCDQDRLHEMFAGRMANAARLIDRLDNDDWQPRLPTCELRTGILLLQARISSRSLPADSLRRLLHYHGIAATTYEDGLLRLSMLAHPWSANSLAYVCEVLRSVLRSPVAQYI